MEKEHIWKNWFFENFDYFSRISNIFDDFGSHSHWFDPHCSKILLFYVAKMKNSDLELSKTSKSFKINLVTVENHWVKIFAISRLKVKDPPLKSEVICVLKLFEKWDLVIFRFLALKRITNRRYPRKLRGCYYVYLTVLVLFLWKIKKTSETKK